MIFIYVDIHIIIIVYIISVMLARKAAEIADQANLCCNVVNTHCVSGIRYWSDSVLFSSAGGSRGQRRATDAACRAVMSLSGAHIAGDCT